jgi:ribosomal protein L19
MKKVINNLYKSTLDFLGLVSIKPITHTTDYQNTLFSNNNVKHSAIVDVAELADTIIRKMNNTMPDNKSRWSFTDIFKAMDIQNSIVVLNKNMEKYVIKYSNDKSYWQLKTSSVVVFTDKLKYNEMLIINIGTKFKRFLSFKKVKIQKHMIIDNYDYVRNIKTPLLDSYYKPHFRKEVESLKERGGDPKYVKRVRKRNSIKQLEIEDINSQENKVSKVPSFKPGDFEGIKDTFSEGIRNIYEAEPQTRPQTSMFSGVMSVREKTLKSEKVAQQALKHYRNMMRKIDSTYDEDTAKK